MTWPEAFYKSVNVLGGVLVVAAFFVAMSGRPWPWERR